jgi:hypothetical protein
MLIARALTQREAATGVWDGTIRIWDAAGKKQRELTGHARQASG